MFKKTVRCFDEGLSGFLRPHSVVLYSSRFLCIFLITCPSLWRHRLCAVGKGNTNPHTVDSVIDHQQINIRSGRDRTDIDPQRKRGHVAQQRTQNRRETSVKVRRQKTVPLWLTRQPTDSCHPCRMMVDGRRGVLSPQFPATLSRDRKTFKEV